MDLLFFFGAFLTKKICMCQIDRFQEMKKKEEENNPLVGVLVLSRGCWKLIQWFRNNGKLLFSRRKFWTTPKVQFISSYHCFLFQNLSLSWLYIFPLGYWFLNVSVYTIYLEIIYMWTATTTAYIRYTGIMCVCMCHTVTSLRSYS